MASKEYTKDVFENFEKSELSGMPFICMKNMDNGTKSEFAIICDNDIVNKKYTLIDRGTQTPTTFTSLNEMLDAGWVID